MPVLEQGALTVAHNADRLNLASHLNGLLSSLELIREMVQDLLKEEQAKPTPALLAKYPRPWRYVEDYDGAGFGDIYSANGDDRNVARLMWEEDAKELIDFANKQV